MKFLIALLFTVSAHAAINVEVPARLQPIDPTNSNLDIRDRDNLVYLDIKTDKKFSVTGNQRLVVMLSTENYAGSEIALITANSPTSDLAQSTLCMTVAGTSCQSAASDMKFYAAAIKTDETIRLGFSLVDLCASISVNQGSNAICGSQGGINYQGINGNELFQNLTVNIAVVPDNTSANAKIILPSDSAVQPNAQNESKSVTLFLSNSGVSVRQ